MFRNLPCISFNIKILILNIEKNREPWSPWILLWAVLPLDWALCTVHPFLPGPCTIISLRPGGCDDWWLFWEHLLFQSRDRKGMSGPLSPAFQSSVATLWTLWSYEASRTTCLHCKFRLTLFWTVISESTEMHPISRQRGFGKLGESRLPLQPWYLSSYQGTVPTESSQGYCFVSLIFP